jgi:hypothetical protein
MLRLGVRVLLLFVGPFFVLSFVPICMLFLAPAYDVTSCEEIQCFLAALFLSENNTCARITFP